MNNKDFKEAREWLDWELNKNCSNDKVKREIVEYLDENFEKEQLYSLEIIKDYLFDLKDNPERFIEETYEEPSFFNFFRDNYKQMEMEGMGKFDGANDMERFQLHSQEIVERKIQSVIDDIGTFLKLDLIRGRDGDKER